MKPRSGTLQPPQTTRTKLEQNGSALPPNTMNITAKRLGMRDDLNLEDPDDVFAKYTVHEVKTILLKLRSEVDAKQEELRLMVGERYRDLLEASTSIISMSESSKRVLDTIGGMKLMVSLDPRAERTSKRRSKVGDIGDAQLRIYQCLSAHLKFLVDAPEHLWRLLEGKQCLHAAWLFLLSRVVYRSLMDENSDESQGWVKQGVQIKEQFPLVQRQWDSISQFRAQISHRATLSLREQDLRPQDLCSSMFTLHLLDSLPLSDALDGFLKQRTRTLQYLYQTVKETWEKQADPAVPQTEKAGSEFKGVWDVVRTILACIVGTVGNARAVFGQNPDGSPSMITQMLTFTQTDPSQTTPSLSLDLRLSSRSVISSLPNASHFQALPIDIRSYRPFIDLDSPSSRVKQETLDSKLRAWFTRATDQLHESSGPWLSSLKTVKKVWNLRSSVMDWLSASGSLLASEDMEALRYLVDDVCRTRVQVLWKATLEKLSRSFRETLQSMTSAISEKREDANLELSPPNFLLSAPPAPSVTHSSLNIPLAQSSFKRFKQGIQQRIDGVTPFVDKILMETETAASRLRNDLNYAFTDDKEKRQAARYSVSGLLTSHNDSLQKSYVSDSETTAGNLLDSIESLLDKDEGSSEDSTRRIYFWGRLAQKLSLSLVITHLHCSDAFIDGWHMRIRQIYNSCVSKCASAAALSARASYARNIASRLLTAQHNSTLPSGPSSELMDSLLYLVGSIDKFAQFKDAAQRSTIAKIVLIHFANALTGTLQDSSVGIQLLWDSCFLKAICDDWGDALSEPVASLSQLIERSYQSLLPHAQAPHLEDLQIAASRNLRHFRLLLSPLVPTIVSSSNIRSPQSPTLEIGRRKTAGSFFGGEAEIQQPLNLVKPSARFGLLWAGTAAAL